MKSSIGDPPPKNVRIEPYDLDMDNEMDLRFSALPPRQRVVLEFRYGLRGHASETLATLGRRLNVTKERVRQLENEALSQLGHRRPGLGKINQHVRDALDKRGGVSRFDHLVGEVRKNVTAASLSVQGFVKLALRLDESVVNVPVKGVEVWAMKNLPIATIPEIHAAGCGLLKAAGRTLSFYHIVSRVQKRLSSDYTLDRTFVAAAIMACPKITILDGIWLLHGPPHTHPRLMECVDVLRHAGQELHYVVIARRVDDWFARQSSTHAIWELLRRNPDVFVRVAPATFGLRWRLNRFAPMITRY
jgi:hypothetical protein